MYLRPAAAVALLASLAGCASLTESTDQNVLVQTVLDHREIAGVGCVLYNDMGKWFVTTPARITLRKSAGPLRIDCEKSGKAWAYEKVESRADANIWGNLVLTAGVGVYVDRNTGAGYDYPDVLTVVMRPAQPKEDGPPPAAGVTLF
ncbi:hypothetical protein [Duganella lactea]|uniref:hypothetical protein n=1 Tax=Duganella lactea TaxID=2692173 RepID=UPI001926E7E2|nr:hypothetical protein [Duganella lactea]